MWPWIAGGVGGAGAACVAYGVFIEHHWFRLTRHRLPILPAGAKPLSVLHLSDLHFTAGDKTKQQYVEELPRPDVAIVTGDLLGEVEGIETAVAALGAIRGREASYFVLGSNDYFRPKPLNYLRYFGGHRPRRRKHTRGRAQDLVKSLEGDGWEHLKNVRRDVSLAGIDVELLGLDDPHIHRADLRVSTRRNPDSFGLAVVHSPDPAPELAAMGWDLIVAGHTHGGQVRLPLVGALVTNSHMPRRLVSGLIRMGSSYLHISQGLGTSKYAPFRFLCRPEATILELAPRESQPETRPGTPTAAVRTSGGP